MGKNTSIAAKHVACPMHSQSSIHGTILPEFSIVYGNISLKISQNSTSLEIIPYWTIPYQLSPILRVLYL